MRVLVLLALLVLAACGGHNMAECKGPMFPMNAGQWQPTPEDMKHE
jgi:type IV secretion system protein VirB7